ncbi:MAG: phosphohistidine phosphatase SixA [Gammaproteobacteria bacterium]|nr:phosphohistidine phosphatase SixA [Gammaproteobacteria bacterium]NVK87994.1 phosphohistidine phosphatase SixA [Gammaproteobacteria bacterium]
MRIWIIRHGEASWQAASDRQRSLTTRGREQIRSVANKLDLPESVTVWHSPYVRAKESCDELMKVIGAAVQVVAEEPLLQPESDPDLLIELLEAVTCDNLILVSHMPLVALLNRKLTGDLRIGGFQTAQVVEIEKNAQGQWQVRSVYAPANHD